MTDRESREALTPPLLRDVLTCSVDPLHGPSLVRRQQAQVRIGDRRNTKQQSKCSPHVCLPLLSRLDDLVTSSACTHTDTRTLAQLATRQVHRLVIHRHEER